MGEGIRVGEGKKVGEGINDCVLAGVVGVLRREVPYNGDSEGSELVGDSWEKLEGVCIVYGLRELLPPGE